MHGWKCWEGTGRYAASDFFAEAKGYVYYLVLTVLQAYACIKMSQILYFKQYNLLYIKHTTIKY